MTGLVSGILCAIAGLGGGGIAVASLVGGEIACPGHGGGGIACPGHGGGGIACQSAETLLACDPPEYEEYPESLAASRGLFR